MDRSAETDRGHVAASAREVERLLLDGPVSDSLTARALLHTSREFLSRDITDRPGDIISIACPPINITIVRPCPSVACPSAQVCPPPPPPSAGLCPSGGGLCPSDLCPPAGEGEGEGEGEGSCFVAGTPVVLADGTTKAIESIEIGDYVTSRDETSGVTASQRASRIWVHEVNATLLLSLENGEKVETTKEHRFFVADRGFVGAARLAPGAILETWREQNIQVTGVEPNDRTTTVYNLEIENFHTYFVGTSSVWVHNKKIGDPETDDFLTTDEPGETGTTDESGKTDEIGEIGGGGRPGPPRTLE